jgi:hypothetical protein
MKWYVWVIMIVVALVAIYGAYGARRLHNVTVDDTNKIVKHKDAK